MKGSAEVFFVLLQSFTKILQNAWKYFLSTSHWLTTGHKSHHTAFLQPSNIFNNLHSEEMT